MPWSDGVIGFNWDDGNRDKCRKHGLTVEEIESAFRRSMRVYADPAHSASETRYIGIGTSASGRYLLVVFTHREIADQRLIRPISARFMHVKEIDHYEAQGKAASETTETQN